MLVTSKIRFELPKWFILINQHSMWQSSEDSARIEKKTPYFSQLNNKPYVILVFYYRP